MTDLFGNYRSQETRALQDIQSSKYPDTNKDFEKNIQRLNQFVDYISSYLQTMQKGVDKANEDPITQLKNVVLDLGTLFGGGELLYGINLGDLQYYLPALAAMFGFDATQPFPLNLLYAAEHFFMGYIIPLDAWASSVISVVDGWATALGLSPELIQSMNDVIDALQSITNDFLDFFNTIIGLFDIFGITDSTSTGPLADLWHAITQLLGGFNLQSLGQLIDPLLNSFAPWIEDLATMLNQLDAIIQSWSGGVTTLEGILKAPLLFTDYMNFLDANWTSFDGWQAIINSIFSKSQVFAKVVASMQIPIGNLINQLYSYQTNGGFDTPSTVSGNADWAHDATTGRTFPGSLKATARGALLRSNGEWVAVQEADVLQPVVYVFWSGLTYTGSNPVKLYISFDNAASALIAELQNPTAASLTWVELNGSIAVPANVTRARLQFVVDSTCTAGSIWWDDADFFKELSLLPQSWTQDLTSDLATLNGFNDARNAALTTLFQDWNTDISTTGQPWTDMVDEVDTDFDTYLSTISGINISQSISVSQMLAQFFGFDLSLGQMSPDVIKGLNDSWSQLGAAMAGDVANAGTWAWLAQFMQSWYNLTGQAHVTSVNNYNTLGIRDNMPVYQGLDNTSVANMPLTTIGSGGAFFDSTITTMAGAFVRFPHADSRGSITFYYSPSNANFPTYLFVNVYRLNTATQKLTYLQSSTNLVSQLQNFSAHLGCIQWVFGTPIAVTPNDVLCFVFQVGGVPSGSGNGITISGANPKLEPHPTAVLSNFFMSTASPGSSHASADILASNWSYQTGGPYVSVELAGTVQPTYPPSPTTYVVPNTVNTLTLDSWVKFVDLVGVGGGGGGQGETGGTVGRGGSPGLWNEITLIVGTDIAVGGVITTTIGPADTVSGENVAGSGGAFFSDGKAGAAVSFSWHDPGGTLHTLACSGGAGGGLGNGANGTTFGLSPGDVLWPSTGPNQQTYRGGAAQLSTAPGNPPGGSGPGGQAFQYGFCGGRGQGWVIERYS